MHCDRTCRLRVNIFHSVIAPDMLKHLACIKHGDSTVNGTQVQEDAGRGKAMERRLMISECAGIWVCMAVA
jgi:hypothetical protein